MFLTLGGKRQVTVDSSTVLAQGGEAVIHRDPDHPNSLAIKVYHHPDVRRSAKLEWFLNHGIQLPAHMMGPRETARQASNLVGFGMRQLTRRYHPIKELFTPSFCEDNGFTTKVVANIFHSAGMDIANEIHRRHFMVGDLNDGSIMVHEQNHDIAWVDVDSWDTGNFPCLVGTQLYLSPDLYGVSLDTGRHFKPEHDWWSFSVLLFRALLRKHPFKAGIHPRVQSVTERATQGLTVLDRGVKYPTAGLKPGILSDDLAELLLQYLKRKKRGPFPLDELERYSHSLVGCKSCGVWYPSSRTNCPQCSEKTVRAVQALVGFESKALIEVRGRILHVQLSDEKIICVAEEGGNIVLYQFESGLLERADTAIALQPRMRFGAFKGLLVISVDDDEHDENQALYLLELKGSDALPYSSTTTGVLAGKGPVFATSRRYLYRLSKNMILACDRFGESDLLERPVTQVFENQCWFTCDPNPTGHREVIFGINRNLAQTQYFLSVGDHTARSFTTKVLGVSPLYSGETLLDLGVSFTETHLLVMRKTRYRGQERIRLSRVIISTAAVESDELLDPAQHSQWEGVQGRASQGGVVMHPSDKGIIRETIADHKTTGLLGSDRLVSSDDLLMPYGEGFLVVRSNKILCITKK